MRRGLVVVLFCALSAACAPKPSQPQPTGTLEPSITESSVEPTSRPVNAACDLLVAEERSDLVGMTMDAEVPVHPAAGTHECIWAHSLTEPARAAIRVTAVNGAEWMLTAVRSINLAIVHPGTSKQLATELRAGLAEITRAPQEVSDERICEIYLLLSETRGMKRGEGMLFGGAIGSLPTVYAAACEDGYVVMAGFGEYGLGSSFALNHGVQKLVEAAIGRVDEVLGDPEDATDGEATEDDETEPTEPDADATEAATNQPADEDADEA